ncbi:hypothetical protein Pth03_00090 [Planotetraspora thailandica]|uniref:Uncharacterized protein n=1 Tax=Planotetraspora thailandica TaxID=487172 RepID=A0A8J3XSY5_9ACTN|nr:hypothetical protein [Planotetraspora thailandica]GII51620.1 hypothetical protein Pth03_00090 [Planotetraspora thailandica]
MTEIGSKAPAWLAVPSARAGEEPAERDGAASGERPVPGDAVPGARGAETQPPAEGGVEGALTPLARLAEAPVSDHVGLFEDVLTGLEAVLASVDEPVQDGER